MIAMNLSVASKHCQVKVLLNLKGNSDLQTKSDKFKVANYSI